MSKNCKNPPTEVEVCCWSPDAGNWWINTCVVIKATHHKIKTQAEAYALQRRLLKKAKRMLDAKRPLDAARFIAALLAIEPGAWVLEYGVATGHSRLVTFKTAGVIHTTRKTIYRKTISIHPKEFCK